MFEISPDKEEIKLLRFEDEQENFDAIKKIVYRGRGHQVDALPIDGDVYVVSSNPFELKKEFDKSSLNPQLKTCETNDSLIYHFIYREFKNLLLDKNYKLFRKDYCAFNPDREIKTSLDTVQMFDGIEYRIRTWRDLNENETFFVLALDYHLRVRFALNIFEIIQRLEGDVKSISDQLRGWPVVSSCRTDCEIKPCEYLSKGEIRGSISEIKVEDFDETAVPEDCEYRGDIVELSGSRECGFIPSDKIKPEARGDVLSHFVSLIEGEDKGEEVNSIIKRETFQIRGGKKNKKASKDRIKKINELKQDILGKNDNLQVGDVHYYIKDKPMETSLLSESEWVEEVIE
ncbi:hypothetical protein AKJ49_00335 [candidate division MSBL1 archaeon SCGC-AAA382A03]|uniref:Uncharacterized protein n=1 Tax=candidate division MSBL1 archaeon SCGC-AAA382A03 TaxID=1698278 RepID=A0A133VGV5_9EURY|nr:hypothetical protein AKJ49_00335 [candidate division MSBL1 archaeon SCGC-AAA382A03]